jgi:hypothetical protein
MSTKIRNIAAVLATTIPHDIADEQHEIAIGDRQRQRGRVLREAAQNRVTIAGNSCDQCGVAIGQCACNGAGARSFASTGVPLPPTGSDSYTANPPGGGGGRDIPGEWLCRPGCYSRDATPFGMRKALLEASRMRRTPYCDPQMDAIEMDTLVSAVTTVAAGVTVDIEVSPVSGTFAAFYYEIVAVDPTTQVSQVDWRAGTPRIEGCPVPCQTNTEPMLSQFVQKVPEACCGQPGIFWLDKRSEDSPLLVPFTNNQAAGDLDVQIRLRGYCCSTKVC